MRAKLLAVLGIMVVIFSSVATTANAAAPSGDPMIEHCDVSLSNKVDPSTGMNQVTSVECKSMRASARDTLLRTRAEQQKAQHIASPNGVLATTLIILFADTNRTGSSSAISAAGNCDNAGYRFQPSSFWATNVSSLGQGNSTCNRARLYDLSQTSTTIYVVPTNGIGVYDNNVHHMQVYNG